MIDLVEHPALEAHLSVTDQGNVGVGPEEINRLNERHFDKGMSNSAQSTPAVDWEATPCP